MTKTKKKKIETDPFDAYVAGILKSYEITPEMRAEAQAQMKEQAARAAEAGVYRRIREHHERAVRECGQLMVCDGDVGERQHSILRDGEGPEKKK